ncbi:Peptidylprolyl isomerase OS=Streptomyces tendae OX=1932 GN=GUR47_32995 PE=4 SV=1 [Streptomyces tendae]
MRRPDGAGQRQSGYNIPDENLKDKSLKSNTYPAGTVAMANTGQPDSGGSQFFLVYQDSPLPPSYTPFGTISDEGMAVLKKIAKAGEGAGQGDGAPNATVVIDKATVTKS